MNLIESILATFRKHATDSSNKILEGLLLNTFEDKDIRYHAGRGNAYDAVLGICNQIETQLRNGQAPDANGANASSNPAVRSTSVPLDEVNG